MRFSITAKPAAQQGQLQGGPFQCQVTLGRAGLIEASQKREGDGATPCGSYNILYGFYRADRVPTPRANGLLWLPLTPSMGWCDAPTDPAYNSLVPVGYRASHEVLWRKDTAYDRLLVMDYNLPATAGRGSAVFIHQLHEGKAWTAGCVALAAADFSAWLNHAPTVLEIGLAR